MSAADPSAPPSAHAGAHQGPERRRRGLSVRWLALAAGVIAVIAYATLCPIEWRPRLTADPNQERLAAFALLGFAAKLAFPRRHGRVLAGAVLVAVGLEAAQMFIPGRDARVSDALVKALGAALGVQLGLASLLLRRAASGRSKAPAPPRTAPAPTATPRTAAAPGLERG